MDLGKHCVCPSLTCFTFLAISSGVGIIYATLLISIPVKSEMKSNITGPYRCTTKWRRFNLSEDLCDWSSCVEWCLNKVKVDVREPGIDMSLENCSIKELRTCQTPDDLENIDLSKFSSTYSNQSVILMCKEGVCQDYSSEFDCIKKRDYLEEYKSGNWCGCADAPESTRLFLKMPRAGDCFRPFLNVTCRQYCERAHRCFNMSRRAHRGIIGNANIYPKGIFRPYRESNPILFTHKYYHCEQNLCIEMKDFECVKSCNRSKFAISSKTTVIKSKETIIVAECSSGNIPKLNVMTKCASYSVKMMPGSKLSSLTAEDCLGGQLIEATEEDVNFTVLVAKLENNLTESIFSSYTESILHSDVKLLVNHDGCLNTRDCSEFFETVKMDGRNESSRDVYPCYFDNDAHEAIIEYEPGSSDGLFYIFVTIPPLLMLCSISCIIMVSNKLEVDDITGQLVRKKKRIIY